MISPSEMPYVQLFSFDVRVVFALSTFNQVVAALQSTFEVFNIFRLALSLMSIGMGIEVKLQNKVSDFVGIHKTSYANS